ncbi:hypothetical protein IT570_09505 [Candidatus Sumerlaeota bacterium]|nr:hypothetical protein [Candidatus Sumerlaeota bacterium]
MADQENNPENFYSLRPIGETEGETRNAWLKALEELASPQPTTASIPSAEAERQKKLEEKKLREAEKMCDETREKVVGAIAALDAFTKVHPYLVAPNIYRMWEENMREIIVMMDRERTRSKVEQLQAE